ncbi:MAG: tetratricopeptide repeat protein [Blastocatellia bacterium]
MNVKTMEQVLVILSHFLHPGYNPAAPSEPSSAKPPQCGPWKIIELERADFFINYNKALGNLTDARECYERVLGIFTAFLGDDHPNTVTVRNNLKSLGC